MKTKERLLVLMCLLTCTVAGAAGFISYKALVSIGHFDAFVVEIREAMQTRTKLPPPSMLPEGY